MAKKLTAPQFAYHIMYDTTEPQRAKLTELLGKGFRAYETIEFSGEIGVFVKHADGRWGLVTPRDGDDYKTSKLILAPKGKRLQYDHITWQRA